MKAKEFYDFLTTRFMTDLSAEDLKRPAIVFSPHYDDETLGCGGLILKKKQAGTTVTLVFMTDGSNSHPQFLISKERLRALRRNEGLVAAKILGVDPQDIICLEIETGKLRESAESAKEQVEAVLFMHKDDDIFIPYGGDRHHDHLATREIVLAALQGLGRPRLIYEYPVWYWHTWPWVTRPLSGPEAVVDRVKQAIKAAVTAKDFNAGLAVRDVLAQKRRALEAYASQMTRLVPDPRWSTLADLGNGQFLQCFFRPREVFKRYVSNGVPMTIPIR